MILALCIEQGGMSPPVFETRVAKEHGYSRLACLPLIDNIKIQTREYVFDTARPTKEERNKQVEVQVGQSCSAEQSIFFSL